MNRLPNRDSVKHRPRSPNQPSLNAKLPRQHVMKRKLVIAAGAGVLLFSSGLAWLSRPSVAAPNQDFSPSDFMRIREVVRQTVWRTALPDLSKTTIKALPRSLRRLGSSRIRQINVAEQGPGTVMVYVQSSSGTDFYFLEKYQKSGRWDWRVAPLRGVINLNGVKTGYRELRVDRGFALLGGQISSEPTDWLPPVARRGLVSSGEGSMPQPELSGFWGSNQVRLTFEPQPVQWEDWEPGYTEPWGKVVSKTPFSASLSNAAGLNLRH
jgi:hypothetical protein